MNGVPTAILEKALNELRTTTSSNLEKLAAAAVVLLDAALSEELAARYDAEKQG